MAVDEKLIDRMFRVGAHFGYARSRRHPSVSSYLFGLKGTVELFDLEKTAELLERAKEQVRTLASEGKTILFVSGKAEAAATVKKHAEKLGLPYVASRWIGGTLTNFPEIRKRTERLNDLTEMREKGELAKYTKLERLHIDREIEELEQMFGGLRSLQKVPDALIVVDPKHEHIAVAEAAKMRIPVIGLLNSDCNAGQIAYPVPGNDASQKSVAFFIEELSAAYAEAKHAPAPAPTQEEK